MNKKLIISIFAAMVLLAVLLYPAYVLNVKTFYHGIRLDGNDISDLTLGKARYLLEETMKEKYRNRQLVITYGDKSWKLDMNEIAPKINTEEVLNNAFTIGRQGNVFNRLYQVIHLRFDTVDIKPVMSYEKTKVRQLLDNIKSQIDKEEKNASVSFNNGKITVESETVGMNVPIDKNAELIENRIIGNNFEDMDLSVEKVFPKITYDDIKDIDGVLGLFKTAFSLQDENRSHNIKLGCERINRMILMPNDIFSMNEALGPRTLENGYREAPVIFKNELVPGTGGGVCQITSTLYNAVLLSGNDAIQRTHHSWPLGYVDPGRDATIAEDYIDFKFQNTSGYPIAVSTEVIGGTLDIRILGSTLKKDFTVKLKNEILEEYIPDGEEVVIDDTVPDNEKIMVREARKGLKVILYKEIFGKNGELLTKEKISEDIYKPVKAQVKVNSSYKGSGQN